MLFAWAAACPVFFVVAVVAAAVISGWANGPFGKNFYVLEPVFQDL